MIQYKELKKILNGVGANLFSEMIGGRLSDIKS